MTVIKNGKRLTPDFRTIFSRWHRPDATQIFTACKEMIDANQVLSDFRYLLSIRQNRLNKFKRDFEHNFCILSIT